MKDIYYNFLFTIFLLSTIFLNILFLNKYKFLGLFFSSVFYYFYDNSTFQCAKFLLYLILS